MKTLKESGYESWPYLHNSNDVCFVWYGRRTISGKQTRHLSWLSFRRTRNSGKLGYSKQSGGLVPVLVPTEHHAKSVEALYAFAAANPELYKLRKGTEWVGPFLYRSPGAPLPFGDHGTCILQR
jgi:hypothetical protein